MTHPTLEDAAKGMWSAREKRFPKLAQVPWEKGTDLARQTAMLDARAVLLSIRPPDGFEVTLKEQMTREYIDRVLGE